MFKIDRQGTKPIYRQISDLIRGEIEKGSYKPGDVIPSERIYSNQLGISRMTVRAAIDELVNDGLLIRRHGRGTVVALRKITKNALGFMSFTEDMKSRGLTPSSILLEFKEENATPQIKSALNLPASARVIFIERVRLADNEPMALERCYLPYDQFQQLFEYDLEKESLYELFETQLGRYPILADETIEPIMLKKREAFLLGTTRGSLALLAKRITQDDRGKLIEAVETIYRADRYRMIFHRRRIG